MAFTNTAKIIPEGGIYEEQAAPLLTQVSAESSIKQN
jgi:hypothetical protein